MIRLPDRLRDSFSEPSGRVYTETGHLLAAVEATGHSRPADADSSPSQSESESESESFSPSSSDPDPDIRDNDPVSAGDSDPDPDSNPNSESGSDSDLDSSSGSHSRSTSGSAFAPGIDSDAVVTSAAGSDASSGGEPVLVTVGDIVTYHVLEAGVTPDVAVTDGRTEREDVAPTVAVRLQEADGKRTQVESPPAELSRELLVALRDGIRADSPIIIEVDGEEDLAAIPAQLVSPPGSSIVYGQPGEGMVHIGVDEATAERARDLLSAFDGDTEAALAVLDS